MSGLTFIFESTDESMNYLLLENVSKSYGDKVLFENINLSINKGDKIGLIAKNGSGKSTLLKVIAGEESVEGENAKIWINKNITTAFLDQDPVFDDEATLLDTVFDSSNPKMKAVKDYEKALILNDTAAIQKAIGVIEDLKAWNTENEIKEILYKFKIPHLDKKIKELSGGQKKRLAIAKIIIDNPDFLVLDEPTNHLDIEMIEMLENYLQNKNLTLLMVTHDRYFLENTCNRIIELDNATLYTYSGNYQDYLVKKSERLHNETVKTAKLKKLYEKELQWLKRQPKARGTKSKSRIERISGIKEQLSKQIYNDSISIDIESKRLGSKILELYNVSKKYGDTVILDDFTYKFKKYEKLGIAGNNGTGKSTFVNILMGLTKPDSGKIVKGETVHFGYFSQSGLKLDKDKRVLEVITDIAEYLPMSKGRKLTAEQLLERFLFPRKQQQVYVSQLSGGEKRRLQLLTVLMKNPNFLILDEPTNDLDIITLNILEDYLLGFKGNLIIITHDRYFMDKLTEHLFILEGDGKVTDFNGTYSEFRALRKHAGTTVDNKNKKSGTEEKNLLRKQKNKLKNEISKVLKEIEKLEAEKEKIMDFFNNNTSAGTEEIADKGKQLNKINNEIAEKENLWEELMERFESL